MATKKISNRDVLNAIREEQGAEYQSVVPLSEDLTGIDLLATFESYPTAKNAFINTLTNRIGRQLFFDKVFNNPFKMLHKGLLPYGKSIEQLFNEMAEEKGFNEHFTGSTSNEADLIGVLAPKVKVDYITQNFEYKFKTSISDLQLRGAFNDQFGLMELIDRAVNQLLSSSEYAEFRDMKKILTQTTQDASGGSTIDKGLIQKMYEDTSNTKINSFFPVGSTINIKTLAKGIRATANKFVFPSTKYNLAGVKTFTKKEDLVLFVTPEIQAELDVELLAMAFNVSSADVQVRTILVDDLGTVNGKEVLCVLADKDIIQAYDTVNTTTTFYNGERLTTNYFAHKHGIMAGCSFAQAMVFYKGDSLV